MIKRINPVAYELKLPANSTVHPVFHVSQLKPLAGVTEQVSHFIPDLENSLQIPISILDRRLCRRAGKVIPQILVHWSSWPASMATWEDEHVLKTKFPRAPAPGQAGPEGGGMSAALLTF